MPQANILFLFCSINLQLKSKPEKTFAGRKTVCLFFSNWIAHNWIRLRSMLSEISSDIADMQCRYILVMLIDILIYIKGVSLYCYTDKLIYDGDWYRVTALPECWSKSSFSGLLLSLKGILMVTWITLTFLER